MTDKPVDTRRASEATALEDQSQYKTQVAQGPLTLTEDAAINGGPLTALRGAADVEPAETEYGERGNPRA